MGIDPKVKVIAEVIGKGVHINLRMLSASSESETAWRAIEAMPNGEWGRVCATVASEVVKMIEAMPLCKDGDRIMEQVRKLRRSIDNLAKTIEITFGYRDRSVSEILKRGL